MSADSDGSLEGEWPSLVASRRAKAAGLSVALKKRGAIESAEVAEAFCRVDRSAFVPTSSEHCAWEDAPLRAWDDDAQCVVHLSAPSIYATALEALDLKNSESGALSFLNIGSGAGYLSALAATILGPNSVHHCVEISRPLVARCRATFERASAREHRDDFGAVPELRHVKVHVASCFDLKLAECMSFDRIYVGAGARASDARFLSKLLKPGGVIVGPFERDAERARSYSFGAQSLLRATRNDSDASFHVDELMAVQFAPLSRRGYALDGSLVDADFRGHIAPSDEDDSDDDDAQEQEEQGNDDQTKPPPPVLRTVAIRGPTWGVDHADLFAPCFVEAVDALKKTVTASRRADALARIPWHVWEVNVLPLLAHDDVIHAAEAKALLKRRSDVGCDSSPKRRFTSTDRRAPAADAAPANGVGGAARRSLAIARALARWTLARLAA